MAGAQNFRLGVNYSTTIDTGSPYGAGSVQAATDSQGNIYLLEEDFEEDIALAPAAHLIKLTPAGDQVVYRTTIPLGVSVLAVDPLGNVYVAGDGFVLKLATDGKTVVYQIAFGGMFDSPNGIAVDATGRAYITGKAYEGGIKTTPGAFQQTAPSDYTSAFVVRLKPDGAIDYATYLGDGSPVGIAVDASGSAFVTGNAGPYFPVPITPGAYLTSGIVFLARLSPDGSALIYSTYTEGDGACCIAVASAGNAVVAVANANVTGSTVQRFNPQGTAAEFSTVINGARAAALTFDGSGNTYIAWSFAGANFPVRNSLVSCAAGDSALTVLDANGNILHSTYIAESSGYLTAVALGVDSTVDLVGVVLSLSGPPLSLIQLSQNAAAPTVQLACVGNAANYNPGAVSGGELVSLFGEGLGPAAGTQPQVTIQSGFPTSLANVQVTFNSTARRGRCCTCRTAKSTRWRHGRCRPARRWTFA